MRRPPHVGDCVRIPDGRIGRVRSVSGAMHRVRVKRRTSETHEFIALPGKAVEWVKCPKGWMSPGGYVRYLRTTLAKMGEREAAKASRRGRAQRR